MHHIDQPYFEWLVSQIAFPRNHRQSFGELLDQLHLNEFIWTISGDDNRCQDARDLRIEFKNQLREEIRFKDYISVLEIIITVSRILEFVAGGQAFEWAWKLIENLGLGHFHNPLNGYKSKKLEEILETFIWRTYHRNGRGGLFPLIFPKEDQTKVEIWYQLNAYVQEIIES